MIVYHGSNSNFKNLRISKSLVKNNSTLENEGLGIYFSTNRSIAESYGKYVYTLEINDKYVSDFRNINTCELYLLHIVKNIKQVTGIDIRNFLDLKDTVTRMCCGGLAITGVGRELYLLLDSVESWYISVSSRDIERVYRLLRLTDNKLGVKAYMFTYHIPDIGVIKDVSDNVVRIVNKESRC